MLLDSARGLSYFFHGELRMLPQTLLFRSEAGETLWTHRVVDKGGVILDMALL